MQNASAGLDLFDDINRLKKERNAIVLAHYYQDGDIQDVADVLGDSLALARAAQKTEADVIVLAGVHFMAETAKILNPEKIVLVPDLDAGCSLADSCPANKFAEFKAENPDHVVVSYVNTTAEIKALSDYICTSTNAQAIVESIPKDQPIIFAPDVNLGKYLISQTGREMKLWQGSCIVHETFNEKRVLQLLAENPDAELIAHPECEPSVLSHAKFIGSTKKLLDYSQESACQTFIVGTEAGILHTMRKASPDKSFIPAAPETDGDPSCGCSTCPFMKLNTLEKVHACLKNMAPEVDLPASLRAAALKPIERMVAIG